MKEATCYQLTDVAAMTAGYSGADLEGVVKAACSFARIGRCMDPNHRSVLPDEAMLEILFEDIVLALDDIKAGDGQVNTDVSKLEETLLVRSAT
jgi:hypothetical protein